MKHVLTALLLSTLLFATVALAENPKVELLTSKGKIVLELNAEKAPLSVENFVAYVEAGFYDGTVFHRIIPSFMIQGGGLDATLKKKTTREAIKNEAKNGLNNDRGTIAMARTGNPHSATAQFFINTVDNASLNQPDRGWGYAVFGKVVEGMDVVDAISAVKTGHRNGMGNVPETGVVIEKAQLVKEPEAPVE
jgi:cyclophilin family peptidyl-prolyl cis-trans isomerase